MFVLEERSWKESEIQRHKSPLLRNVRGISEERQKEAFKKRFIPEEWLFIPEERYV